MYGGHSEEDSANVPRRYSRQLGSDSRRGDARPCGDEADADRQADRQKPLRITDLREDVRDDAAGNGNASSGTRTPNPLIKSQFDGDVSDETASTYGASAGNDSDTDSSCGQNGCRGAVTDPELRAVVEAWTELPAAVRAGILAMVKAAR
jgi:hypothetical protein